MSKRAKADPTFKEFKKTLDQFSENIKVILPLLKRKPEVVLFELLAINEARNSECPDVIINPITGKYERTSSSYICTGYIEDDDDTKKKD